MVRLDLPGEDFDPSALREALAGRVPGVPPSAVLGRMAGAELPDVEAASLLREVALSSEFDVAVRAGAVGNLMRLSPGVALATSADLVANENDLLSSTAALALGRLGAPDQLPYLEPGRRAKAGVLTRRSTAFAEMLIVHRFGLTDREVVLPELDVLPAPPGAGAMTFVSVQPGAMRRREALGQVSADLSWVNAEDHDAVELQCGARLLEIIVANDLGTAGGRRALAEKPAVMAVVAAKGFERDEFVTSLLALSRPTVAGELSVLVTRLTGEPVYVGDGAVTESALDITLHAVRSPGSTAVAVHARVSDDGFELAGTAGRSPKEPGKAPQRMSRGDST